jgi:hypothetical protein
MLLLRLSGHPGAGKSRLTAVLSKRGLACLWEVLFTSRAKRDGEVDGMEHGTGNWNPLAGPFAGTWELVNVGT